MLKTDWILVEILDLKIFKFALISYGMYSPFVKKSLTSWLTSNRIAPQNWKDLVTALLEPGPQLQWMTKW